LEVAVLADIFGTDSLYVLIIAVIVLFGGSQLPKLARNAGEAMKEFRKAHNEAANPLDTPSSTGAGPVGAGSPATSTMAPQPVALPPVPAEPRPALAAAGPVAASAAPSEERVTLTRAELDALLANREAPTRVAEGGERQSGAEEDPRGN
jgi:sec-independent protein translocase protein TatA